MDLRIIAGLREAAQSCAIMTKTMACGAGHDAAVFAGASVPTGMVFIRNEHGSHNPKEHMEIADFSSAAELVSRFCLVPPDVFAR